MEVPVASQRMVHGIIVRGRSGRLRRHAVLSLEEARMIRDVEVGGLEAWKKREWQKGEKEEL